MPATRLSEISVVALLWGLLYPLVGMAQGTNRIATFDSRIAVTKDRTLVVNERVEIDNQGAFDQGVHRRLPIKQSSRERPQAASFEDIRAKVDGNVAQIRTAEERNILDIAVLPGDQNWSRGNHVIEFSYVGKRQFAVYDNFEDLNQNITGEWPVLIERATVGLEFPSGMPPRAGISADTGTSAHFEFDCVRTNLPLGVRFETSHPLAPNQRLFISARFTGRGYFASPDEKKSGIRAVFANHSLLSVIIVAFVLFTMVAYVVPPAQVAREGVAPRWIRLSMIAALPGTAALALRLMHEQTIMTWRDGEQMVGFSLAHAYIFLFLPMLLSVVLAHFGLLSALSVTVGRWLRGLPTPKWNWLPLTALCVFTGLMYVPYEVWMATTIRVAGPGRHGTSFLMMAAADGKLPLAKVLVEKGVSANTTAGGSTALDVACSSGSIDVAQFLLEQGADISRAPNCAIRVPSLGKGR